MKLIGLTKGFFAIVDDEDFDQVNQFKWRAFDLPNRTTVYACREVTVRRKRSFILMHRFIMGFHHKEIDHKDGDGLNNMRGNLRPCIHLNNGSNRKLGRNNTSGFKGVSFHKGIGKWQAVVKVNFKPKYLGVFDSPKEAALVYDAAAIKHFGEFAKTNQQLGLF